MNPSYEPRVATVAYRAVAWLQTQPRGEWYLASKIAEAIGYAPNGLQACLAPAIEAGLVECAPPHGQQRPLLYRLAPERHPDAERRPAQRSSVAPVEPLPPALLEQQLSARGKAELDAPAAAEPAPAVNGRELVPIAPQPAPRPPRTTTPQPREVRPLRLGLWSDGTLHIERPGSAPLVLPPSEANALRRFLATINTIPTP